MLNRAGKKVRHVLLEGPDCSGKTTLAKHLSQDHGFSVHAEGPPPQEAYFWHGPESAVGDQGKGFWSLMPYYKGVVGKAEGPTVFDRLLHSEWAYAPVMRPGNIGTDTDEIVHFSDWFRGLGGLIVLCLPPYSVCRDRWIQRKGLDHRSEYLEREAQLYQVWAAYSNMRVLMRPHRVFDLVVTGNWDDEKEGFPCHVLCR
jgi:hypothetical protein